MIDFRFLIRNRATTDVHGGDLLTIDADGTFAIVGMPRGVIDLTLVVAGTTPLQLYVTLGRPDSDVRYSFTRQ